MNDDSPPPESDLPQDDWDLDDHELTLGESVTPEPRSHAAARKTEGKPTSPEKRDRMKSPQKPRTKIPPEAASTPDPSPAPAPAPEDDLPPSPEKPSSKKEKRPSDTTLIEKISVAAVLLILAGLFVWLITSFLKESPEGTLIEFTTDFPVEGQQVTIESVDTWWRQPVREGENVDVGVVIEAQLIPCAEIELSGSGSAQLQVSFRDGDDNLIGDIVNLTVENGKFARSNSPSVVINSSDGFKNASDINPYANQDIDPWSIVIVESDHPDTRLVKARIVAESKESKSQ